MLAEFEGRVSLKSDMWPAPTTMIGYTCLTTHYVDDSLKLNNKILAFCGLKLPHAGEKVANKLLSCLKEWELEKKAFSITLNDASYKDSMQKILNHKKIPLSIDFTWLVEMVHVRCCAHILNSHSEISVSTSCCSSGKYSRVLSLSKHMDQWYNHL